MNHSKRIAARMKELTADQLFRIANYVPDNEEMYDDAAIASIYMQIRAAADELHRRRVKKNPPHHFFDVQAPARLEKIKYYPEQHARAELAIKKLNLALNRVFGASEKGDEANEPVDIRGLPPGPYAFQTSGIPGFAGDYVIGEVMSTDKGPMIHHLKTLYTTTPDRLYTGADTPIIEQFTQEQMVPAWNTPTIQYDCYMPAPRGKDKERRGRRAQNGTSPLECDERLPIVMTGVEKILKLYQPVYGPMTWQVIFEASKGVSTEFPGQVRNAPFTPGEVAEAIRRLVKNGKARIQSWRKLDYAPPDLNVKDCTAKFCEPFFELGPASLLRDKGGKGKGRRNPRRR